MERKRYDLDFKKMVVAKGEEIGNMTAVARQHVLPLTLFGRRFLKMLVLGGRWSPSRFN